MKILALDLGKFNTMCCFFDTKTRKAEFLTAATDRHYLATIFKKRKVDLVVMEACGPSGWINDLAVSHGLKTLVCSTNEDAWKWSNVKRKTDKDDALKLAKMARNNEINSVHIPSPEHRQFQQLVRYRKKLQSQATATQNAIRSNLMAQGEECAAGKIAWSKRYIENDLGKLRKPFEACTASEYWRGTLDVQLTHLVATMKLIRRIDKQLALISKPDPRIEIVQSIPGVGVVGAQVIVAHIDDPKRFASARKVSSYAGLVPKKWQSGTMDRQNRISRRGPRLLRSVLTEVAWCALRFNPHFKALYDRVRGGSKSRKKQAIIAVARKILVTAWAMLRDGTIWSPPKLPSVPQVDKQFASTA
jgi:transposase